MSKDELIAEINGCFENKAHPGDLAIAADSSESSPEASRTRAVFKGLAWQEVPDSMLRAEQTGLALMSAADFSYYLPAFMRLLLQDSELPHNEINALVKLLKLPTEISELAVANLLEQFERLGKQADVDFDGPIQAQLAQTNADIHQFIARASQFSPTQGRTVYHFLTYVRDKHSEQLPSHRADLAIQRYWFQFE